MTRVTFQDGKVVLRDGKVGTEEACCCGGGCENCPLTCCLTIDDRNTCETDTVLISADPLIVVNFGSEIQQNGVTVGSYQYLSDAFDTVIEFSWICSNGVISLDITMREFIPGAPQPGDPPASFRRWMNARATLGADGCPTGIEFGEPDESEGPDPVTMPTFAWLCT